MVQRRGPFPQKEFFAPKEMGWLPERPFIDLPQEGRFTAQPAHSRCLAVEDALRDCARISVTEFALMVLDESGEVKTYTSASLKPLQAKLLPERVQQNFRNVVQWAARVYDPEGLHADFDPEISLRPSSASSDGTARQFHSLKSDESEDDAATSGKRKRARSTLHQKRNRMVETALPGRKKRRLVLGDTMELEKYYTQRFKDLQQVNCKIIGKAFVKLVEPKKQSSHPYTKGNAGAPEWWPQTDGPDGVEHREPDHLKKNPRVKLLVHIIRMIAGPRSKQCEAVQMQELTIEKLKEVTMESMANVFSDKNNADNDRKRAILNELFKVAQLEWRYMCGELDGTASAQVDPYDSDKSGDKSRVESSDDDESPEDEMIKVEEERRRSMAMPATPPDGLVSPTTMMPNQSLQQPGPGGFCRVRTAPVRTYSHSQLDDHHAFGGGSYIPRGFQPESPLQDPNRRGFQPPSFPTPAGLYDWQNGMTSSGPVATNFYLPPSPQSLIPPLPPYQAPQHGMLAPRMNEQHFDMSTGRYDSAPALGNQLRTGSLHHPHQVPHGFHEYLHDIGPYGRQDLDLKDELHSN